MFMSSIIKPLFGTAQMFHVSVCYLRLLLLELCLPSAACNSMQCLQEWRLIPMSSAASIKEHHTVLFFGKDVIKSSEKNNGSIYATELTIFSENIVFRIRRRLLTLYIMNHSDHRKFKFLSFNSEVDRQSELRR